MLLTMAARLTARQGVIAWCRPDFEGELAAELTRIALRAGWVGHTRARRGEGYVIFAVDTPADETAKPGWSAPIFARACRSLRAELEGLAPNDRLAPVLDALAGIVPKGGWADLVLEHADSDAGKPLAPLARSFGRILQRALSERGWLAAQPQARSPRLFLALLATDHLLVSEADADQPPWPGGIPRLRLLRDAPSRSALKLEEALARLLSERERERWLRPGMQAVDLGAAPGGWSWILARHLLQVTAIDNGPLAPSALATGRIRHLRADGFRYRPSQPVDWMVCDMVEQPARVASRIATWLREGWCRRTIFNLKLPMKKRLEEVDRCLALLVEQAHQPLDLRARQLYHDREEITVFARPARA